MKGTSKSFPTLPYGQGPVLLTAIFFEEDGGVTGFVEFLGVSAHGRNLKEARSRLTQATEEHMHEPGKVSRQRLASYGSVTRERLIVKITRE